MNHPTAQEKLNELLQEYPEDKALDIAETLRDCANALDDTEGSALYSEVIRLLTPQPNP